jgi:hypothetical protein
MAEVRRAGRDGRDVDLPHPVGIARDVGEVFTLAKSLQRLAVKQCNVPFTSADYARRERISERLRVLLDPYGFTVTTSGDPRGNVVKLLDRDLPSDGQGDGFGRDGWGVY